MSLPNPAPQPDSHITTRAIIVGLILTLVICYFATDTTYRLRASRVSLGHMPMSLWLPFLLIFLINPLLKKIRENWMLRPHELGLILCMGFIGSVFPTKNVAGRLIAVLASPITKPRRKTDGRNLPTNTSNPGLYPAIARATSPIYGRDCQRIFPPPITSGLHRSSGGSHFSSRYSSPVCASPSSCANNGSNTNASPFPSRNCPS